MVHSIGDKKPETGRAAFIGWNAEQEIPGQGFDGIIDEVAIHNRALSGLEIWRHYQNGLNGLKKQAAE